MTIDDAINELTPRQAWDAFYAITSAGLARFPFDLLDPPLTISADARAELDDAFDVGDGWQYVELQSLALDSLRRRAEEAA